MVRVHAWKSNDDSDIWPPGRIERSTRFTNLCRICKLTTMQATIARFANCFGVQVHVPLTLQVLRVGVQLPYGTCRFWEGSFEITEVQIKRMQISRYARVCWPGPLAEAGVRVWRWESRCGRARASFRPPGTGMERAKGGRDGDRTELTERESTVMAWGGTDRVPLPPLGQYNPCHGFTGPVRSADCCSPS